VIIIVGHVTVINVTIDRLGSSTVNNCSGTSGGPSVNAYYKSQQIHKI